MSTLIEGFPDEVSLMILARVPLYLHPRLRLVCHAWNAVVNSVELLKVRKEVNFFEDFMCVCSNEPEKIWQLHDAHHNVWITIPVLPSPITRLCYFGAVSTAGKLYVLGGLRDPNYDITNHLPCTAATNQVWSYEPVTRQWTLCAPMIMARAKFACGVLDGKIIVAGGFSNSFHRRPIGQAEIYDPKTNGWIPLPDLPLTHNAPCYGVVVREKMHVVHKELSTVQILDNGTQVWTVSESLNWRNYPLAAVGDEVYVLCDEKIYHENQVGHEKQLKFTAYGYNKKSGFAMSSLGNSIYLIGGNELRGNIFNNSKYESPDVTVLTLSLEEPCALHKAKPMTRCRGTILGCTPLRV
ncbi:F-box/kelch-repeat protein SKIP30 [Heracleum sosnowskyi]|uniref:F-box/kelch-repeat protein SKIP30 n=1 Tax=Heracleum sosnowskyi TaxID=360622 RepID=A0AAD8N917_9APIA|nr:F-box/kelch-repeat protein SKIP30 [Heracleum sosnowskyi]